MAQKQQIELDADLVPALQERAVEAKRTVTELVNDAVRTAYPGLRLTKREIEVLSLIAKGHSSEGAAKALSITTRTVAFHLANIYEKLRPSEDASDIAAYHARKSEPGYTVAETRRRLSKSG